MCGRLRHEKLAKIYAHNGYELEGFWNGHAREESLDSWKSAGVWKEATLSGVEGYTEGRGEKETWFPVPNGHAIKILYAPSINTSKGHPYKIVTRPAEGKELEIHDRFPRVVKLDGG